MDEKIYTVKQVADYLQASIFTLYDNIKHGKLDCIRLGGNKRQIRITQSQLDRFMYSKTKAM